MEETQEIAENLIVDNSYDLKIRETEGEFYVDGWIYTTHMDRANDGDPNVQNTMFSKRCMEQIAEAINNKVAPVTMLGSTRAVSIQHDWIKANDPGMEPIGMTVPPVEVRQTKDGQWGVFGTMHMNKLHPQFEDTKYRVEHGYYPGYSIEFDEGDSHIVNIKGRVVKFIESIKSFVGYGLASARRIANPEAIITGFGYREVEEALSQSIMTPVDAKAPADEILNKEVKIMEEVKQEVTIEQNQAVIEAIQSPKEEAVVEVREAVKTEVDIDAVVAKVRETKEYKEAIENIQIKSRVLNTGNKQGEKTMEDIKIREMNEAIAKKDLAQLREAAIDYANESGICQRTFDEVAKHGRVQLKSNLKIRTVGKGLQIVGEVQVRGMGDTASNTESTYTQSPVEFADLFAPGIISVFNNTPGLFSYLEKEQHPGGIYFEWKLMTDDDGDSNATMVDRDDVTVLKNFSSKVNLITPIKVARRGVSVTDFTLSHAAASLGDLFSKEVEFQMQKMMRVVGSNLFAETQDGAGNNSLGLEAVADVTGNTTLYGKTRSTTNKLTTGTLADTYRNLAAAVSEEALRLGIQKLKTRGTQVNRMAIVTSPAGKNFIFNLLDTNRRFLTTQAEFGFNQLVVPSFDGIPVIEDWQCYSTLVAAGSGTSACAYLIDRDQDKIIMDKAPQLTALAKVGAATEAYLEMYFAHVYKDPRKIYQLDNFLTG